jgi:hypothetical integral membrane protein (TIGR02206 family)
LSSAFILFGPAHLIALALALIVPVVLAALVRWRSGLDRAFRYGLALLLAAGWLAWLVLFALRGWLTVSNELPLNLCDWATVALVVALLCPSQRAYELGYFWGLGGTVQGLLTPDIARGFPDPQFLFFFLGHGGIIAALLYLTLGARMRPTLRSLPRVVVATLAYAGVAGAADAVLGTNYGFLRAKPANASIMDFLSPWPWYIPELVAIGLLSMFVYYVPFGLMDLSRRYRTQARVSPSREISGSGPRS